MLSLSPVLDERNHLRVSLPQNAFPIHLHQPVPWIAHAHIHTHKLRGCNTLCVNCKEGLVLNVKVHVH